MSSGKKYYDLKDFLKKHKTIPEKKFTHTALGQPPDSYPGSYCIEDDELSLFHNLYNKFVFEEGNPVHLTEAHKDNSSILIDLDLRHKVSELKRHYDNLFIEKFIEIYFRELNDLIPGLDKDNCKAFVMEKDTPNYQNIKSIYKDGIHIVLPFIITEPKIQYILRYKLINSDEVKELFDSINVVNTPEDIFDIAVIEKNNWQMYGSCKPNNQTYKLTSIYSYYSKSSDGSKSSGIEKIDSNYSDKELLKILSIRNIKEKYIIEPSMYYNTEELDKEYKQLPKNQQVKKKKKIVKKKRKSPIKKALLEDKSDLNFIKNVVKILSQSRVEDYHKWIRLGWCLHNIDFRLLEDWVTLSKKSEKFVDGECEKEWYDMDNDGLGIGTLYMWAREDNHSKFKELSDSNLRKCMMNSLTLTPNDIAKVVYNLYKQEFVCSDSRKNVWYQFRKHRWVLINDAVELRKRLSKEIINEYDKLDKFLADQISHEEDEDVKDLKRKKKETISKIIKQLKTTTFKGNVIKECSEFFHDDKFEEKLDTNINLIGFENGIYDLDELKFRDGFPEDYVHYSAGINYLEHEDDDEDIIDVKTFVTQVLPKKNVREYVLTLMGSILSGKTSNEKFHIWVGSGGNGKSKLIELFEYAFGDYCCKLPVTLLTQQRARAEGANPSVVRTKGKRFACLQEPEKNEQIQVGLMKELTGGDKIIARALHKDPIEFKPQFKLVMTCNKLIKPSSNDNGVWRRISVVDFPSRFVDEPDPNNKYEFKIDDNLNDKLKIWPEAFMYILIEYYKKFKKSGIREPAEVRKNNEDFKAESDVFALFINEKIIENTSNNKGLKIEDIYFIYQEWFKQTYGQNKTIDPKKDLKTNLIKRFGGNNDSNIWYGISFKETQNEE